MNESSGAPVWERMVEHAAFSRRDTAEAVVFHNQLWLSNGYCEGATTVRDLWRSADGLAWTRVGEPMPYPAYAEMAVYRDRIWAIKESVWNSADGEHWQEVAPTTPFGGRGYGELVVFHDELWQLGSGPDVWHTADGVHWECACTQAPYGPRHGTGVAVYQDRLWLLCGATAQPSDPPEKHYAKITTWNDIWSSPDGSHWTRVLEHAPWPERMWCVSIVYAGKLWLIGGFSNRRSINFAEAWYTDDGVNWQDYHTQPMFSARHEVSLYDFRGSLWLVAGNFWPLMHDVWRLTLPEPNRQD